MLILIKNIVFLLFIGNILHNGVKSLDHEPNRFRNDYTFDYRTEGWFKVHPIPVDWQTARLICHSEGAELASPLDANMVESIKELVKNHAPKLDHYFSGVHQTFGNGIYTSIEGVPFEKLHIPNWNRGEPNNDGKHQQCLVYSSDGTVKNYNVNDYLPYICYRKYSESDQLTECGTIDEGYKLDNRTGSCYKYHEHAEIWERAHKICHAEGGYLAVVNSRKEAEVLLDLYIMSPRALYTRHSSYVSAIGYREWGHSGSWWTVHGQTLKGAGYEVWGSDGSDSVPYPNAGPLLCGGFKNRGLIDISCDEPYTFICEKNVNSLID